MHSYAGPIPGDERPVGGGSFNKKKIGHEVYNFQETKRRLYGYFQPSRFTYTVNLERIDPKTADQSSLNHVLVVFVAPRRNFGQVVVGWYKDAEVFRRRVRRSPGKPRGYGHFCSAESRQCVLLPVENRDFKVPRKNGVGQSNVCYPLNSDGSPKQMPWVQRLLDLIDDYRASDIRSNPVAGAEAESAAAAEGALARSKGQGFARTPEQRRAIEDHSMKVAKKHSIKDGYSVEDVSRKRSYDLLCKRRRVELHVEVKGTTTDGDVIVLTNNEVKHARNANNSCALFVVHSIHLHGQSASGGKQFLLKPWRPQQALLTPVSFTYRLG
jgi:hypothetical protein